MLRNVHLKNLALIREAEIDFQPGLNIMTGETGSGKSIIIGSINIALGDKASKTFIRNGSDYGLVELCFDTENPDAEAILKAMDISAEEKSITVSRKLTKDSATARINGETVNLQGLKSLTSLLIDVHGQHEHQSLMDPANHLLIIDDFGGSRIAGLKSELKAEHDSYRALRNEYANFNMDDESLAKEKDFLRFETDEIEKAALTPSEDEKLESEYRKLLNLEKTAASVSKVNISFNDENSGITAGISNALKEIEYAMTVDPELKKFRDSLLDLESVSKDFSREIAHFAGKNVFDAGRFAKIQDRLNEINRLKSKYGNSIDDILVYQQKNEARLNELENYAAKRAELKHRLDISKAKINGLANDLSAARKETASNLEPLIINNLKDLNFLNVDFVTAFSRNSKISSDGYDRAEFMISTNPGEPVKPLAKVASGGEISRVMLAIKSAIADRDRTETLIFDEIDEGISGRTAQKVGEKLASLSRTHQVICITHLPQIAAMADVHFAIEKSVEDGSTISGIRMLSDKESVDELARLVGGSEITKNTLFNAAELKENAQKIKSGLCNSRDVG